MRLLAGELLELVDGGGFLAGGKIVEEGDVRLVVCTCGGAEAGDDFADAGWDEGHCDFSTCRAGKDG